MSEWVVSESFGRFRSKYTYKYTHTSRLNFANVRVATHHRLAVGLSGEFRKSFHAVGRNRCVGAAHAAYFTPCESV